MGQAIVEGSMVQTPSSGVPIDRQSFREAALQRGAAGSAIGSTVGDFFSDLQQKMQDARNTKKVFDAQNQMTQTYDGFVAQLSKNPELAKDPDKWLPAYRDVAKTEIDSILGQDDLSRQARKHLEMMTENWRVATTSDVQINALKRETADTKVSGMETYTKATQQGDGVTAAASVKALNEAGVIGPQETQQMLNDIPGNMAEFNANSAIQRFPTDAPKLLPNLTNWDKIAPNKQKQLMHTANEALKTAQNQKGNEWDKRQADAPDGVVDLKSMQADRDRGLMSPQRYDEIKGRMDRRVEADQKKTALEKKQAADAIAKADRERALLIGNTIINSNFVGDPTPANTQSILMDQISGVSDVGMRNRLTSQLQEKMKSAKEQGRQEERPVVQTQLEQMRKNMGDDDAMVQVAGAHTERSWDHWFGVDVPASYSNVRELETMDPDKFESRFGSAKREDLIAVAKYQTNLRRLQYAVAQKNFLDWAHDEHNEKAAADPIKASEMREHFEDQARDYHPDISKRDYDALPAGATYWHDGTARIKTPPAGQ